MTYPDNCPLIPSASTIPTVATTPDDKPSHADYNLSPLEVPLSYRIARAMKMLKTDIYSLPNILARACNLSEEKLVPELMQDDCTAGNLADATLALFRDSERRSHVVAAFEQLHQALRGSMEGHAGDRAAAAIVELIDDQEPTDG